MSINFEAANMAGYNNPPVQVLKVTTKVAGGGINVDNAPSYSAITNIVKSGCMPVLFVALPTGDKAVLPFAAITHEGEYIFSAAASTSTAPNSEQLISIIFGENFERPAIKFVTL